VKEKEETEKLTVKEIFVDDTLQDDQFVEDFALVNDAVTQQVSRFGRSTLDPTEFDGKQIDRYILKEIKKYGHIHNGFVPKKIQQNVFDRCYCIPITGMREKYLVFFHPIIDKDHKISMDHQRIHSLATPRGRYHLALLLPGRIFVFKSHCVFRLQERTSPGITEEKAMTLLMNIAYNKKISLSSGYQSFDVPEVGGQIKARVGVADVKGQSREHTEDGLYYIIICYTYYPASF
jgi:hypothetical protein